MNLYTGNALYSIESEQIILGTILNNNDKLIEVDLKAEHFYDKRHQLLFMAMHKLFQEDKKIDFVNISSVVEFEAVGGVGYLADLVTYGDVLIDKFKVEIIKECYYKRKLYNTMLSINDSLDKKNFRQLQNELLQSIIDIEDENDDVIIDRNLFLNLFDEIDNNIKLGGRIKGLRSNITSLDIALNGFQNKKLYVIAGRPGMGKSALITNIANNISRTKHVLYYSLEMSAVEIGFRRLACESFVNMARIEKGKLCEEESIKLRDAGNKLYKCNMMIIDKSVVHINDIYRQAKKMKLKGMLDMLIVDHIGLVNAEGLGDNERQRITNICIILKRLAKDLDIPVVAISQLNRGTEIRADKRPTLGDLKESSGIEENADVVMLLYRDDYYNYDSSNKGIIEVNIAKQRGGQTGVIKLNWKPEYQAVV